MTAKMWRRSATTSFLMALTTAFLLVNIQIGDACSCMRTHPQTHYCHADFVILARIKGVKTFNQTKVYKVRVRKEYKLSEKATAALKSGRLLTSNYGSMCGISLELGKTYAISGRVNSLRAHVTLCDMAILWQDLTRRQRKGLKAIYKHGCTCRIDYCPFPQNGIRASDNCCVTSSCHVKEGICLRQKNKKCMWTRNRMLTGCLKENPLTISRWSG